MPGSLIPGDLELIFKHQRGENVTPEEATEWLLENFQASDGAKVMQIVAGQPHVFQIPTIVPKLTEQGCVFLKEGKCQIHEVAPFACAYVDPHMPDNQANELSQSMLGAQMRSWQQHAGYAQAWEILHAAGKIATPLVERKQAVRAAFESLERSQDEVV